MHCGGRCWKWQPIFLLVLCTPHLLGDSRQARARLFDNSSSITWCDSCGVLCALLAVRLSSLVFSPLICLEGQAGVGSAVCGQRRQQPVVLCALWLRGGVWQCEVSLYTP
jgi:hypothetical protein